MKKNNNSSSEDVSTAKNVFGKIGRYIRSHYQVLLLLTAGFAVLSALNFFNVATSQTIASFTIDDFEIGQIADRTIYADKSIPADEDNPVSIEAGEKIIRKEIGRA